MRALVVAAAASVGIHVVAISALFVPLKLGSLIHLKSGECRQRASERALIGTCATAQPFSPVQEATGAELLYIACCVTEISKR